MKNSIELSNHRFIKRTYKVCRKSNKIRGIILKRIKHNSNKDLPSLNRRYLNASAEAHSRMSAVEAAIDQLKSNKNSI